MCKFKLLRTLLPICSIVDIVLDIFQTQTVGFPMQSTIGSQNLIEQIVQDKLNLSNAFRRVATFITQSPVIFIHSQMRELAEEIGVSEPTLVRFSRHYGYKGLPDFRIAVAMSLASVDQRMANILEPSVQSKSDVNITAKTAIARTALKLVESDTSIALDSGSTITKLAEELADAKPLRIMTTSLISLLNLRDCRQHELMVPGGTFRPDAMSIGGRMAEAAFRDLSFDTAYIGADSIDPELSLSTFDEDEAHLTRTIIVSSRRIVVLADASKFKSPALHRICNIARVDIVVTDALVSSEIRSALVQSGVELIVAHDDSK